MTNRQGEARSGDQAKDMDIDGGSAFRAVAGFGRHGLIQEERFFELAGNLPVEVVLALDEAQAHRLLDLIETEKLCLFYVKMPAEYGVLGFPGEENHVA